VRPSKRDGLLATRYPLAGKKQRDFGRIGPPYGSINPRMAPIWHPCPISFEETWGDVQDIRLVVDTIPYVGMVPLGPDGSADFCNQRWLDYTGLSAEQALGSAMAGLRIHPDDLPRISRNIPGSFEFCKAVRSGWAASRRFRRRISLVSLPR